MLYKRVLAVLLETQGIQGQQTFAFCVVIVNNEYT